MKSHRTLLLVAAVTVIAACDTSVADPGGPIIDASSGARVINASSVPVNVRVDGTLMLQGVSAANVSAAVPLSAGPHTLRIETATGTSTSVDVTTTDGAIATTFVAGTAASLSADIIPDTGSIVPAGKSKLRVIHMSPNAGNIEIWRTQPDFSTGTHIMTPFPYQATSPYLQSDPGPWEVYVTPAGSTSKIATTGVFLIPDGGRRTVVLLDSAGVMRFKVITQ